MRSSFLKETTTNLLPHITTAVHDHIDIIHLQSANWYKLNMVTWKDVKRLKDLWWSSANTEEGPVILKTIYMHIFLDIIFAFS